MKGVFTKPVAHFMPLAKGMDTNCLASSSQDELTRIYKICKDAEDSFVFQVNPDVLVREIANEWVLVPTGEFAQQFNGMISLNIFSHFVWQQFEKPNTLGAALQATHDQFDDPHRMMDIQVRHLVQEYALMGLFKKVDN